MNPVRAFRRCRRIAEKGSEAFVGELAKNGVFIILDNNGPA
jgi:hypothetical protein